MSSKRELEQQLDKLPPNPYKSTADLREMHRLLHKASEVDEGVPHRIFSDSAEDINAFVEEIKPSNLGQALKILDEIEHEAFSFDYHPDVLKLALSIYLDHNSSGKIDHKY